MPVEQTETPKSKDQQMASEVQNAINNNELPHLYCNGFTVTLTTSDVLLVLKLNDAPVAVLNTSYTVAKTLAGKLGNAIVILEDRTGNTIMTTEEVDTKLHKEKQND